MKPMKPHLSRFRRIGYVARGVTPPWWQALALAPLALRCKASGWTRDRFGRLTRPVRRDDPPSALFLGSSTLWMDHRCAGGERVFCWSYWHATLLDWGAWHAIVQAEQERGT